MGEEKMIAGVVLSQELLSLLGEDIKLRPFREEKRPSARAGTQTLGVEDLVEPLRGHGAIEPFGESSQLGLRDPTLGALGKSAEFLLQQPEQSASLALSTAFQKTFLASLLPSLLPSLLEIVLGELPVPFVNAFRQHSFDSFQAQSLGHLIERHVQSRKDLFEDPLDEGMAQ
jgi:hypothetical protein